MASLLLYFQGMGRMRVSQAIPNFSNQNFAQRLMMASYIGSIFLSSYIWLPLREVLLLWTVVNIRSL